AVISSLFDHRILLVKVGVKRSGGGHFLVRCEGACQYFFGFFLFLTADLKLAPFPTDSCAPAHLKLVRFPARSPLPSRLYLLCRFSQKLHSTSPFAHLCRAPPVGSVRSPLPFAALPSISLFPSARFTDDSEVKDQPSCNNAVTILAHAIRQDRSAPPADRPKATKESCTISVRACSGGLLAHETHE